MGLSHTKVQLTELHSCINNINLKDRPARVYHIRPILSFAIETQSGKGNTLEKEKATKLFPFVKALKEALDPQTKYTHETDALLWEFQLDLWTKIIVVLRDFLPDLAKLIEAARHLLNAKIPREEKTIRQCQEDLQLVCGLAATHRVLCEESELFTQRGMVVETGHTKIVCRPALLGGDFYSTTYEMIMAVFALFERKELLTLEHKLIAVEAQNSGPTREYITRRAETAYALTSTVDKKYKPELEARSRAAHTHSRQLVRYTKLQPGGIYVAMVPATAPDADDDFITIFDDEEPQTDEQIQAAREKRLLQAELGGLLAEIKTEHQTELTMPGNVDGGISAEFEYRPEADVDTLPGYLNLGGVMDIESDDGLTIGDINCDNGDGITPAMLAQLYKLADTQPQKLAQVSPEALAKITLTQEQLNRFSPPPQDIRPIFLAPKAAAALTSRELKVVREKNRKAINIIRQLEDSANLGLNKVHWLSAIHFVDTDCSNYTKKIINDMFRNQMAETIEEEAHRDLGDFDAAKDKIDIKDYEKYGRPEFPPELFWEQWQIDRARRGAAVLANMDLFQASGRNEKRDVTQAQYLRMGSRAKFEIVSAYWKQLVKMYSMRVSRVLIDNRRAFTAACRLEQKLAELRRDTTLVANAEILQEKLIMIPSLKYHIVKKAMRQLYQLQAIADHHTTKDLPQHILKLVRDVTVYANPNESPEIRGGIIKWLADREANGGMTIRGICDELLTCGRTLVVRGQTDPEIILTAMHLDHLQFDAKSACIKIPLQSEEPGKSGKGLNAVAVIRIVPIDDGPGYSKNSKKDKERPTKAVCTISPKQTNGVETPIKPMRRRGDTFEDVAKKEAAAKKAGKREAGKLKTKRAYDIQAKRTNNKALQAELQRKRDAENKLKRHRARRRAPSDLPMSLRGFVIPKIPRPPSPTTTSRSPPALVMDSAIQPDSSTDRHEMPPPLLSEEETSLAAKMIADSAARNGTPLGYDHDRSQFDRVFNYDRIQAQPNSTANHPEHNQHHFDYTHGHEQSIYNHGQLGYPHNQPGYPHDQPGYSHDQPGHPRDQYGYHQDQTGYHPNPPQQYQESVYHTLQPASSSMNTHTGQPRQVGVDQPHYPHHGEDVDLECMVNIAGAFT